MSGNRWSRVQEILADTLAEAPESRAAYVTRACGDDTEMCLAVQKLLAETPTDAGQGQTTVALNGGMAADGAAIPEIAGYEELKLIGEGGMGTVWRARQLGTRQFVALKLMIAQVIGSVRARKRFEREVELAARFQHEHIARVYDSGIYRGAFYYAMELVNGRRLDAYVNEEKLSQREILQLMHKICRAVQYAHQRGVIHRDLKPSNILVTAEGEPKLLDFGLAKALHAGDSPEMTLQGEVAGTPGYMAPEQAAGDVGSIGTPTDVYALGAILYQLLLKQLPFVPRGNVLENLKRIAEGEITAPGKLDPSLDGEIQSILLKALNVNPAERYASAGELAADLSRFLEGELIAARPQTLWYFLRKKLYRHRYIATAAAAAVILIIAAGTFHVVRIRQEEKNTFQKKIEAINQQQLKTLGILKARTTALKIEQDLLFNVQRQLAGDPALLATRKLLAETVIKTTQNMMDDSRGFNEFFGRWLAVAHKQLGDVHAESNQSNLAREQYLIALDELAQLKDSPDLDFRSLKHDELVTRCGLARLDINPAGHAEATKQFEQAGDLVSELRKVDFNPDLLNHDQWVIEIGRGEIALVRNEPGQALTQFRAAEKLLPSPEFSRDRFWTTQRICSALLMEYDQNKDAASLNEAAGLIEQAIKDCRDQLATQPEDRRARIQLAGGLKQYARVLRSRGQAEAADKAEAEAKALNSPN